MRRVRDLLVVLLPALVLAAAVEAGWPFASHPVRILDHRVEFDGAAVVITWETDQDCYSWVETRREGETRRHLPASLRRARRFQVRLEDLVPETSYSFRVASSEQPPAAAGSGSWLDRSTVAYHPAEGALEFRSPPALEIRDVQVVERRHDRVTIRWRTSRIARGRVRVGRTRDHGREVVNREEPTGLDHAVVVGDLAPNTVYHYQVVSRTIGEPEHEVILEDRRFVTRPYVHKEPDHRHRRADIEAIRDRYRGRRLPRRKPFDLASKQALVSPATTPGTFWARLMKVREWTRQLLQQGVTLPDAPESFRKDDVMGEIAYLKALVEVNPQRAAEGLDRVIALLASVDRELLAGTPQRR